MSQPLMIAAVVIFVLMIAGLIVSFRGAKSHGKPPPHPPRALFVCGGRLNRLVPRHQRPW